MGLVCIRKQAFLPGGAGGGEGTLVGWALPQKTLIKKTLPQTYPQAVVMGAVPQLSFLLSGNSSLCQGDKLTHQPFRVSFSMSLFFLDVKELFEHYR